VILPEELLLYAPNVSSCQLWDLLNRVLTQQAHVGYDVASLIPSAAAATVIELSVAADAKKAQTKHLVKAVGMARSEIT